MAAYTWNVTNPNGHDGDMVLRQYSSFNLSSGNTLTANNDCRGVMIFVDGDATINGTITVVGAYGGTPADNSWNRELLKMVLQVHLLTALLNGETVLLTLTEYFQVLTQ